MTQENYQEKLKKWLEKVEWLGNLQQANILYTWTSISPNPSLGQKLNLVQMKGVSFLLKENVGIYYFNWVVNLNWPLWRVSKLTFQALDLCQSEWRNTFIAKLPWVQLYQLCASFKDLNRLCHSCHTTLKVI